MGFSVLGLEFDGHSCSPITSPSQISKREKETPYQDYAAQGSHEEGRHGNKVKEPKKVSYSGGRGTLLCGGLVGLSWPPSAYTCSFCKREFRSAQALGGHMNVHRKDRARLRHWNPPLPSLKTDLGLIPSLNPNPRTRLVPNTALNSGTSPPKLSQMMASPFPSLVLPLKRCASSSFSASSVSKGEEFHARKQVNALVRVEGSKGFLDENRGKNQVTMGMCNDVEGDLDLELRLGYA